MNVWHLFMLKTPSIHIGRYMEKKKLAIKYVAKNLRKHIIDCSITIIRDTSSKKKNLKNIEREAIKTNGKNPFNNNKRESKRSLDTSSHPFFGERINWNKSLRKYIKNM